MNLTAVLAQDEDGVTHVVIGDEESSTFVEVEKVVATVESLIATANWANEDEQMHVSIMLAIFRTAVLSTL